MRVLFVSVGALGHVHPMVPLARALIERGHELRWVTSPEAGARLASIGIRVLEAGPEFEAIRAEFVRRYPEAALGGSIDRSDHVFPRLFGEVAVQAMVDGVVAAARSWQPDLVVQDQAALAGPIAAATVGARTATHSYGGLLPERRLAWAAERVAPLWRAAGLEPRPYGGMYDGPYLDIYPPSLQAPSTAHVPRRQSLRPVAFDETEGDETDIWPDPDDARPLVYLTLGTIARDPAPLQAACAAIASLDIRLLVTVGPSRDPAILGPQPPNVVVQRYVPQTRVFEACAAIASHGGSGTFLAALARGIPQLCLPQAADQFINAAACSASGAGIALLAEDATGEAITEAMRRLLADEAFRRRATDVAAEIATMPSPAEVAEVLEIVS